MTNLVEYFRIAEGDPLLDIAAFAPFRAVVVIAETHSSRWQDHVSDWLVESGCLYMMAWGDRCSSWDDSVDLANIRQFPEEEIPDASFVMTTWHENEPLEEVFWFALFCAEQGDIDLQSTLIIHISNLNAREEMLARFEAARDRV